MAAPEKEVAKSELPDPKEVAKTYAEVAQRASKLLADHIQKQVKKGDQRPRRRTRHRPGLHGHDGQAAGQPLSPRPGPDEPGVGLLLPVAALHDAPHRRGAGTPVATPAKDDKRFKDEEWQEHFLFDFMKQSYLIAARHIHDTVSSVDGLDDQSQKKVNFYTRQYIDALSPSNFALTNPEVFRETVKSHGQNLIKGLNNLLRDVEDGGGNLRVKMTDTTAFELGKNVATTPGKVVFQNDMMQLLQYTPSTPDVSKRPLMIVPPWINKFYILDLREKNSYIKWCVDQGHTVFVISWVNPDERQAEKSFDSYLLEGTLAAVDAIVEQTGAKEINAAGYCLGGTLLATTLAYMAGKKDKRIASGTFFTTMTDFADPGELGVFIDEGQVSSLEKKMFERGYLEGSEMAGTFNMLRANDLIWSFVVNNYLMGKDPFPFDLLYWNSDSTRMPAKMHSFYLRNMYMKNLLKEPGGIEIGGVAIDLSKIKVRPTSSPPSKTTSPRGRAPTPVPATSAATCASCWAAPATSPASSTRRQPTSMATGPTPRRSCPPPPTTSSLAPSSTRAPGGPTGKPGCSPRTPPRFRPATPSPAT
jgi:polyhydroxyalkanoate synthase